MLDPRLVSPAHEMQRFLERERQGLSASRPGAPPTRWPERDLGDRLRGRHAGRVRR